MRSDAWVALHAGLRVGEACGLRLRDVVASGRYLHVGGQVDETMRQLRELAKAEGICLGYDGSRKSTAIEAIRTQRQYERLLREELASVLGMPADRVTRSTRQ